MSHPHGWAMVCLYRKSRWLWVQIWRVYCITSLSIWPMCPRRFSCVHNPLSAEYNIVNLLGVGHQACGQACGWSKHCSSRQGYQRAWLDILNPQQNGCHNPDNIFKCIFILNQLFYSDLLHCNIFKVSNLNLWYFDSASCKDLVPCGKKPLPERMHIKICDIIWHHSARMDLV